MSTDVSTTTDSHQLVVFSLGPEEYGVPITLVQEIIRYTEPRPIPGSPHGVEGVINLRGRIIPVVELRARFASVGERPADSKIVIVELNFHAPSLGRISRRCKSIITRSVKMDVLGGAGTCSGARRQGCEPTCVWSRSRRATIP